MDRRQATSRPVRRLLLTLAVALVAIVVVRSLMRRPSEGVHEFVGTTMGTTYSVKIAGEMEREERSEVTQAIRARLDEVDHLMSTYDPESELSRFNLHRARTPFAVSEQTLAVFRVAREVSELSGGAFDVTVGPMVEAWGFGATRRAPTPPAADEMTRLRGRVGYRLIEIDERAGTLSKRSPLTVCDLSAIAKGFAVDRVADAILGLGHERFLVEVGGELKARGRKSDGAPWRVGIETPDPRAREVQTTVALEGLAMATSGDYRNFYEVEGRWISHLIDPRSGRPIEHRLASVTVIHPQAVWADALATALIVLGPEEGYAVAEREGIRAYFIVRRTDGGFTARGTSAFASLLENERQNEPANASRG